MDSDRAMKKTGEHHVRNPAGFTLLEVAVVIVIICILASMLVPLYSNMQDRSSEANCVANLKSLYVGASGYMQANQSWPQIPNTLIISDPVSYAKQWVKVLEPFGIPHQTWICPAMQRAYGKPMSTIEEDENYRVDYIGMAFGPEPHKPYPEKPFPWFVEKGGMHGRGNMLILSDGSVIATADMAK